MSQPLIHAGSLKLTPMPPAPSLLQGTHSPASADSRRMKALPTAWFWPFAVHFLPRGSQMQNCEEIASKCARFPVENEWIPQGITHVSLVPTFEQATFDETRVATTPTACPRCSTSGWRWQTRHRRGHGGQRNDGDRTCTDWPKRPRVGTSAIICIRSNRVVFVVRQCASVRLVPRYEVVGPCRQDRSRQCSTMQGARASCGCCLRGAVTESSEI